jgi:hypothetical protein
MRKRIALFTAAIAVLGTGTAATTAQASPVTQTAPAAVGQALIDFSGQGWCLKDPGERNAVVTSNQPCATTFTFTNGQVDYGQPYYLMRINGGVDCLQVNVNPESDQEWAVMDEPCNPGLASQLWTPSLVNSGWQYYNLSTTFALGACNPGTNASVFAGREPGRCHIAQGEQTWDD